MRVLHIHSRDNVAVAVDALEAGAEVQAGGATVRALEAVPAGHKIALRALAAGEPVVKYGHVLGSATEAVAPGAWVHSHNLRTDLSDEVAYTYAPTPRPQPLPGPVPTFQGYRRKNGRVGTRNEVWVVNTVGCVNRSAERIARICNDRFSDRIDGVHAFSHPYGCSQLGDDLENTQRVLAGLIRHPNAGGVLVIGLGCENNRMEKLLAMAGDEVDRERIRYFQSQLVGDEVEAGVEAVEALVEAMAEDRREACPVTDLVLGVKCGGSDAFSGVTANPLVGRVTDRLTGYGGTVLQTEVPEMFGAEQQLMNRAADRATYEAIVDMINRFKRYFIAHNQPIYENPSPGNKEGGLTTLEEKSLGAVQKGGQATVTQVLDYGEAVGKGGLALVYAPGNDAVSVTAEVASGATVVLFTTGRGTPLGFPVPTLKVSTNSAIYAQKPHWIDFNAGALLDGTATMDELADELFRFVLRTASGAHRARNEENDYREIAIWKGGVTL